MGLRAFIGLATGLAIMSWTISAAAQPSKNGFKAERVFDLEYANDPQISPRGDEIVYVRQSMDLKTDRIRADLWIIDTDTGRQRPLVTTTASSSSPVSYTHLTLPTTPYV